MTGAVIRFLACDDIRVINWGYVDLPDVAVDEGGRAVEISGTTFWRRVGNLPEVFVSIISHESLHVVLLKIDEQASEALDNIGSLSTVSRSLRDVSKCGRYPNGLIGFDSFDAEDKK